MWHFENDKVKTFLGIPIEADDFFLLLVLFSGKNYGISSTFCKMQIKTGTKNMWKDKYFRPRFQITWEKSSYTSRVSAHVDSFWSPNNQTGNGVTRGLSQGEAKLRWNGPISQHSEKG